MARRDLTAETAEDKFNIEAEARRRGIEPYQLRATQAVGDRLVRELVSDAYKGISQSASMIPPSRSSEPQATKGNGWQEAAPIGQPPGVDLIDRMCEAQDRADRVAAIRKQVETEWIELLMEKPSRIATDYNPLSEEWMKK